MREHFESQLNQINYRYISADSFMLNKKDRFNSVYSEGDLVIYVGLLINNVILMTEISEKSLDKLNKHFRFKKYIGNSNIPLCVEIL